MLSSPISKLFYVFPKKFDKELCYNYELLVSFKAIWKL